MFRQRETVPSLREDSPVTFGELPAGVSLEVDTSSMHAAANGNLNLTLTEPAAFSDFDAHSAMDLDTSAGQRGTPRYGSPRSAPVFALDSDDDDHGTQYESARSTPGLVNDSDDDDSDNSVSQQANESEDASAEAMVTPNERTTRKVKTGRISKKKPAKEKKVRDLSHLMARPFAPKLNTKPRQKPDPLPKFRVNNRPGTKFDRALRARQEKANQSGILVERCVETAENGGNVDEFLAKLRYELHALEHYDFVWEETIRDGTKLMQEGFPTILANPIFPWDIKGDARMIRTRWAKGDFDAHLLRGIATSKPRGEAPKSMVSNVIEKDYPHGSSAAVMGAKDLQNGQWWPKQICAVRDGAHGALMEGIFGISGKGAYSIVMSGSGYSDVDEGDVIKYCGTSGQASGPTPSTKRMMESWENGNPVRVLRSSGMKKNHSDYRPSAGIRYDGLYKVAESELLDAGTSMYRFTLRRCDGQDPIRYQGVEVKPHGHDANEYIRLYQK